MRSRITIQTTERLEDVLEQIRVATDRSTKSDVVRDALELYDLVVRHTVDGEDMYLGTDRESASKVTLPHLDRARQKG